LSGRTVPPTATTRSSSTKARDARSRASAFNSESASTAHTSGYRATLSAAFTASDFPPFSLSTTIRFGYRTDRRILRTGLVSMARRYTRGTSTREKASTITSSVLSVDPSWATTTSNSG
jgi:hypothetical protein